ncbi:helix-turn-helix domain-containing protein [Paenibacillus larvae]|nr:helix-turn-helix domain-containing protein [Paenibacillus larvae]MDT2276299.1 helix-turn-helix domain-containing protein [Paenibacillus larvae]
MSKRSPTSLEVKLRVVKRCLQNETNPSYEAKQLGIDKNTVTDWVRKYKADGLDGLKESRGCKAYSYDPAAIRDVLSGEASFYTRGDKEVSYF